MKCNQDCNQGRQCDCDLKPYPTVFETLYDFAVAGLIAVGVSILSASLMLLIWEWFV